MGIVSSSTNSALGALKFNQCMSCLEQVPKGSMTDKVVQAVGGQEAFCNLPELNWDRSFGTIDRIQPGHLEHPLMRIPSPLSDAVEYPPIPSLAFRTIITDPTGVQEKGAEVIFQRYPDSHKVWVDAHQYARCPLFTGAMTEDDAKNLERFIRGETLHDHWCYGNQADISLDRS